MKRFKVGDMARVIGCGDNPLLQPYIGQECSITAMPGICECQACKLCWYLFHEEPTKMDYRVEFADTAWCIIDDPYLIPIGNPDAAEDEFAREEEDEEHA